MLQNKPSKKKETKGYNSPAVEKAIDVLEFLASQGDGVSITAISEGLGRSVGEIYRIVRAMEHRRLVSKDPATERFSLSLRLFELAHQYPPIERLTRAARAEMALLSDRTLQSCHLAVVDRGRVIIVAAEESPLPMHYGVKVGASFNMLETSSGAVIAAFSSTSERSVYLGKTGPLQRAELESRFNRIVHDGFEIRQSDVVEGISNIAVPVRSQEGLVLAALTVPYLKQKKVTVPPLAVLELQIAASRRMQAGLG